MTIVDTHQHLWGKYPCSWCAGIPALARDFGPEDYEVVRQDSGIVKTVFVEADVDEPYMLDEARHVQELSRTRGLIAGIVAAGRPEHSGFSRHLQALAQLPAVRGVRRILHTQPDALSQSPLFPEHLRLLPDFGFSFDLCVLARQLPLAYALVESCPQVNFILDHCGVPDLAGGAFDPWREWIMRLAAFPNLTCKVSGIVAYAHPATWTTADLRPWVEHVIANFGWDRVLWGSDWPVCNLTATLPRWLAAARELVAGATEEQQHAFFRANAERVYRV